MFSWLRRRLKKNCQDDVEVGDKPCSSPQKSVIIEMEPKQQTVVHDTTATPPKEKTKKSWWRRLFRLEKKNKQQTPAEDVKDDTQTPFTDLPSSTTENTSINPSEEYQVEDGVQEVSSIPDTPVSAATEDEHVSEDTELLSSSPEGKYSWFSFLNSFNITEDSEEEDGVQEASTTPEDEEVTRVNTTSEPENVEPVQKALSTPDTLVAAATEDEDVTEDAELLSSSPEGKYSWFSFLNSFNITEEPEEEDGVQEVSSTPDTLVSAATEDEDVSEDTELLSSAPEDNVNTINESEEESGVHKASSAPEIPVRAATESNDEEITCVNITIEPVDCELVQEASSTPDTPVSAATEDEDVSEDTELLSSAPEEKYILFSFTNSVNTTQESQDEDGVQEASPTPDTPVSVVIETGKKKEKVPRWLCWLLPCCRQSPPEEPEIDSHGTEAHPSDIGDNPRSKTATPAGQGGRQHAETINSDIWRRVFRRQKNLSDHISREQLVCLGFPNLAQTCYMNSTLQGLLTLRHFVQDIKKQQKVWISHPRSKLIRGFVDLGRSHLNSNKKSVLAAFKDTVAEFNSEFKDHHQKDAHEFLSSLLNQMKSLTFDLQASANSMGFNYTCPVDANISFQMLNIRTCKGCGIQSMREEDYINLSLDLVHGGSVNQCLQEYFKVSKTHRLYIVF
ncbi:uncharacterized protein LOC131989194 [Centropristis striata]|uniref:uncharacterized protein LOC131989194 n=1 Tax=Centropristis striata TaxID=184440 RepID=UPI0027DFC1AB|nr:uncharacterized protein LOC131989194 [Centropristis striata]